MNKPRTEGMPKMDKSLKAKWLRALRSGKFQQWRGGALMEDPGDGSKAYCCLGVLRHLADPKDRRSENRLNCFLTKPQIKTFGLPDKAQRHLAELNDDRKSFKEIAAWISKYL